jgi:hypothetical protein
MEQKMASNKYRYWTTLTAFCFERKCRCEGCCEANVACRVKPMKKVPYGMRPIKYAALQTFANIGLDGYEEALNF